MRKDAFNLCLTSLVLGIFGFFLRWLQNVNAFEAETGLAIAGAGTSIALIVYSVVAFALLLAADKLYLGRRCQLSADSEAVQCPGFFHKAVLWLCAAVAAVCWLIMMFSADRAAFPMLQRVTSALGILACVLLPFAFAGKKEGESGSLASGAAVIPVIFCCVWLISDYRVWAEEPVLWLYVIHILAIVALTMAFYHLAAFHYGKAKPGRCLLYCQIASYLCICTLTDGHSMVKKIVFGAMVVIMLAAQFIIIENGKAKE